MAPSQPWSAAGPEKPMTTVSPYSAFSSVVGALVDDVLLVGPRAGAAGEQSDGRDELRCR